MLKEPVKKRRHLTRFLTNLVSVTLFTERKRGDETEILKEVSLKLAEAKAALVKLQEVEKTAGTMQEGKEQAFFYKDAVRAAMDDLRRPVDELESFLPPEPSQAPP